ncbi:T9SS type A sorting domain-containing protein, partial [candidate division WOR-3 bacterium]|nr:T9SS type A sorting domain-containing protein [candidate division WOR-3 bacterium]
FANSLTFGFDGNLYAAGQLYDTISHTDFGIISLTTSGVERWTYQYDYNNNTDCANEVIYGSDGNIYATGAGWGGSSNANDFVIVSLNSSGNERWTYTYNGSADHSDDHGLSIVQGSDGNIYVAGYSKETGSGYDFTVISLTSSGNERWVYHHNVPGDSGGAAYSIVYGNDNNLYIAGYDYSPLFDFIVISIDTSGQERWVYRYNGPGNGYDMANYIIYGDDGNLYVAGHTEGVGTSLDFTVISLNTSGAERWVYQYNGPWNVADFAEDLVYGDDGNIYATGGSYDSGPANEVKDFIVACIDTAGVEKWVYLYNGPAGGPDFAYQLDYGTDGNLYIAGMTTGIDTEWDFTILSLDPYLGIKEGESTEIINTFDLYLSSIQSSKCINFSLSLPSQSEVSFHLFNVIGQVIHIKEIVAPRGKSEYNLPLSLPSGIYFLQIKMRDEIKREKICIVK